MTGFSVITLSGYAIAGVLLVFATYKVSMWHAFRAHRKGMAEAARILAALDDDEKRESDQKSEIIRT